MTNPFTPLGAEFLVNTVTANSQHAPTITSLSSGGFVISWYDLSGQGGDASDTSIKAQIFDASGAKAGAEFLVNTATANYQYAPTITSLASGGFVVSWNDYSGQGGDASGYGIKAQIFDASGAKAGAEFLVNTATANQQYEPTITSLASGGFVVSWYDASGQGGDASGYGIKAQIFDASGAKAGAEFLVNTATANQQYEPTITSLASGGFVVSWYDLSGQGGDASNTSIKAQIFDASGAKAGAEFLVNTATANSQYAPTITSLASGGFVVSWTDDSGLGGDTSGSGIKAQIFDASGAKAGAEFLVNTATANQQFAPTITSLASGGFVVSWTDDSGLGGDTSGSGIKAQIFDASGAKAGAEFLVNTATANQQFAPTITSLASGGFVVSWNDYSGQGGDASGYGIKAQIFSPSNTAPVITSGAAAALGAATETISLNDVRGADQTSNAKLEPVKNLDPQIAALLSANADDMPAVVASVQALLGSGEAQAFATIWDYIDDNFSYYNNAINEASARLGVEYALYLQDGGAPLTGTAAKYAADGGDAGSNPDRHQSLHDNLLGNVHGPSLQDKLLGSGSGGSNPSPSQAAYDQIITLLADNGLSNLLTRPIFSGAESASNAATLAFDQANGYAPLVGGQLTASDAEGDALAWSGDAVGTYGSFKIDASTGQWTYVLNNLDADTQGLAEGEEGIDSFTATVTDTSGATATQTVTVTVTGSNDAPVGTASAVLAAGTEDTVYNVSAASLLAGFSDLDGDVLSVAGLVSDHGVVTSDGSGGFNIAPTANYNGPVALTYQVVDGNGGSASATQAFTLGAVNDGPVITSGAAAALGAATETISLNDVRGADQTSNAKLEPVKNLDPQIAALLSANADDMPAVVASVQALLGSGEAQAFATIWDYIDDNFSYYNNAINEASARLGVEYALYLQGGGEPLTGTAAKYVADGGDAGSNPDRHQSLHDNLLGNVHGPSLQDKLLGSGSGGSNPSPSQAAYDQIITLLADNGLSNLLTRPIFSGAESASNAATLAFDQANGYAPLVGGQLTASDAEGDALAWSGDAVGTYGSFKIDASTGQWTYVLNNLDADTQGLAEGEEGIDSFTATVTDTSGATATQTVTVTVTGSNDAPVGTASAVLAAGTEDTVYNVSAASLLAGFSDLDGDVLSVAGLVSDHGVVTSDGSGGFNIAPTANYNGPVALTYQVVDGNGGSASATQAFTLGAVNDGPVITSAAAAALGAASETISLNDVRGADQTSNAKLEPVKNLDPQIAALLSANADDMPAVVASVQALLGSGEAQAFATIWDYIDDNFSYYNNAINEASARLGVEYALYLQDGGAPLTGTAAKYAADGGDAGTNPDRQQSLHDNLLGNVHGPSLQDKLLGSGSGGSNPSPSQAAYDQIIALLADNGLSNLLARPIFSGTEGASNAATLAFDQANGYAPLVGGQLTASDAEGDALTWSGDAVGTYGAFKIDAGTGQWTYVLNNLDADTQGLAEGEEGIDSFTATVSDGTDTATQTVTVTVTGSNDAPVGTASTVLTAGTEDVGYSVTAASLLAGFSDLDGDVLSIAGLVSDHGAVTSDGAGTFTITPTANYNGPVVLTYQVVDGNGGSASATQAFSLAAVNDGPTDLTLTGGTVAENSANNTVVGYVATIDPDAGDTATYSLVDNAGGRFAINAATGEIRVANGLLLNFETATSHDVRVKVLDSVGVAYEETFAIQVSNVAETQTINGTAGPDTITPASSDNWVINALAGNDTVTTQGGADIVRGNAGDDIVSTGAGADIITFSGNKEGFDVIDGGSGTDRINALANTTIVGLKSITGVETISANGYSAVSIGGSAAADTLDFSGVYLENITKIAGGAGNDVITGSAAGDTIIGEAGNDELNGGDGDDTFSVGLSAGVDSFNGGDGTDRILATAAKTVIGISELTSIEQISANGLAGVTIAMTTGDDVIDFSTVTLTGIVRISGGSGADQITGSAMGDTIVGGAGNDILFGGGGDDTFELASGYGADVIDGGAGTNDRIVGATGMSIVWKDITGIEAVTGSALKILGTANGETLDFSGVTLTGVTKIYAGAGNDTIVGSSGADILELSTGQDTLTGGAGADLFDMDFLTESLVGSADTITDFEKGIDKISLVQMDASTKKTKDQAFTFIDTGAFTGVAGQLRVEHADMSSTSIFGDVNGDMVADFQINLSTYVILQASDFSL